MKTSTTTTGGRKAPAFTDTQAMRNRRLLREQAEREGRLLAVLIVECCIFGLIIGVELLRH